MTYIHSVEHPLGDGWTRLRVLYLTTRKTHKRQTFKIPAGFEPTIPTSEKPQTHALELAANSIESRNNYEINFSDSTKTNSFKETENLFVLRELQSLDSFLRSQFVRKLDAR